MSDQVRAIGDTEFETEVLQSGTPTLVDFWAPWCGPCKAIAPVVEELAQEYAGKVAFKKINIDENPSTPVQYHVKGIPTLILFKDGKVIDQLVGSAPKERLKALIGKVA
ncbi:MAG: thioredoxin [Bdellovibrionales bacterium]|nr:thioredoxin [Bdellovibrionales bacterium]